MTNLLEKFLKWCDSESIMVPNRKAYNYYQVKTGCQNLSDEEAKMLDIIEEHTLLQKSLSGAINKDIAKLILKSNYDYIEDKKNGAIVADNVTLVLEGLGDDESTK